MTRILNTIWRGILWFNAKFFWVLWLTLLALFTLGIFWGWAEIAYDLTDKRGKLFRVYAILFFIMFVCGIVLDIAYYVVGRIKAKKNNRSDRASGDSK